MGIDPKDVDALQKALNDAAGKASLLWTTFVTFELYLAIAFGAVTHRDLFLETPIRLPVLNVELPLVGFFVVAPTVLVIFHFYVFLQLLALAKKAGIMICCCGSSFPWKLIVNTSANASIHFLSCNFLPVRAISARDQQDFGCA